MHQLLSNYMRPSERLHLVGVPAPYNYGAPHDHTELAEKMQYQQYDHSVGLPAPDNYGVPHVSTELGERMQQQQDAHQVGVRAPENYAVPHGSTEPVEGIMHYQHADPGGVPAPESYGNSSTQLEHGYPLIASSSRYPPTHPNFGGVVGGYDAQSMARLGAQHFAVPGALPMAYIQFRIMEEAPPREIQFINARQPVGAYRAQAPVQSLQLRAQKAKMVLPQKNAEEEPPRRFHYINPKQYPRILIRRVVRAKEEAMGRRVNVRKPYRHQSRHDHAVRRARGRGGRFLKQNEDQANTTVEGDATDV